MAEVKELQLQSIVIDVAVNLVITPKKSDIVRDL